MKPKFIMLAIMITAAFTVASCGNKTNVANAIDDENVFEYITTVEVIAITEEITVVGLSYNKCTETGSLPLGSFWDLYGHFDKLDGIDNKNIPDANYAICVHGDYWIGKGVTDADGQDPIFAATAIPTGIYMKTTWNAETFDDLVGKNMGGDQSVKDAFIAEHGLYIPGYDEAGYLYVEVYPQDTIYDTETSYPECYTLNRIRP